MSGFVSFPESESYSQSPSSYVNIYDRVKDAASSVVYTLMTGSSTQGTAPQDSNSVSNMSIANQSLQDSAIDRDRELDGALSPPPSQISRPSISRAETTISIAPVSEETSSSSVAFIPSTTNPTVGITAEPPTPMLTSAPSITVDSASDAFTGDADSIMSTMSYSRAYLSAQYSRARKGPVDALSKEFWMKDENATSCFRCSRPFTTFRRRHHCRICGQIFCHSCTRLVSGTALGGTRAIRCCDSCNDALHMQNSSSDEDDTTAVSFVGSYPDNVSAAVLRRNEDMLRAPLSARWSSNVLNSDYLESMGSSEDDDEQDPLAGSFSNRVMPAPPQSMVHFTRPRSNTNRSQRSIQHLAKFPMQNSSIDLSSAAVHHTEAYIRQLISESELPDDPWSEVLLAPLYTAVASIHPEFLPSQIDPRHWIKIKRICGGSPQDIECINGTVFTHSLAKRVMPSSLQNPRLLLITFPIEYSRGVGGYMSLEPILAQEDEYLKKLVARIEGLKPTMILSTTRISGTALEMLSAAGIAVACNVPVNALHRLARYTQADVLTSIDRLSLNPRLGFCAEFERRLYRYGDMVKTFLFFTGISANSGCTIVLRGGESELERVKMVMEIMAVVVTSLKLETALMRDQFVLLPTQDSGPILSSSPFVDFGKPYLQRLTQQLEDKVVLARPDGTIDFEKECPLPEMQTDNVSWASRAAELGVAAQGELPGGEALFRTLVHYIQHNRHERAHALWDRAREQWEQLETQNPYLFSPTFHQSLVLIFASLCRPAAGLICIGPETVVMDYYLESDLTLGQWIEQFCQTFDDTCPENCGHPLSEHDRVYIQGEGRLCCSIEKHDCPLPGMTDTILMWSFCTICEQSQPVVPMSASTWKYSLGKYFELSFWGKPLSLRAGICAHNVYRDHIRYFGWHDLAVKVIYEPIELYDMETPSPRMHIDAVSGINYKIRNYLDLRNQLNRFWDSVLFCVKQVKLEGLEEEKMNEGMETLKNLAQRAESDRQQSLTLLNDTFVNSEPTNALALNEVLLKVQSQVERWHQDFSIFDGMFFPTEKDIRRVTAQHLRSLFLEDDKLSEDEPHSKEESAEQPNDTAEAQASQTSESLGPPVDFNESHKAADISQGSSSLHPSDSNIQDVNNFSSPINIASRPELSPQKSTSSVRVQTEFGNPIDFHVGSLESTASKAQIKPTKKRQVSFLVEHFEELSREFERERIRERQRLKERRDALSLKHAPPVAEIFQDVNDAVEKDWNDDESDSVKPPTSKASEPVTDVNPDTQTSSTVDDTTDANVPDQASLAAETASDSESRSVLPLFERNSLIKSLVNFWAERSSTRWSGIEYMLSPTEHLFNDSLVVIREDEPSSVIAFCLSLPDYQDRIKASHPTDGDEKASLEQLILKQTAVHMRYHFEERQTKVSCKIFFSEQFDAIRQQCGVNNEYLQSLSRCIPWEGNGGKSGSTFLKTQNDRFILKELSQPEFDAFVSIAPSYFEYTAQSLFHDLPSVLARIFGFYQIQIRNVNRQYKLYVMVMENLFYGRDSLRIFDLKGSMRNRKAEETGKANEVLLDENMVEYIHEHPLFVREHTKKLLRTSLYNDSLFLTKMNVMDYSLVIGIDEQTHKVYGGLVDFVRTYTWDKKIESWVKGRTTTRVKEPTVVSPRQYKVRFRESMEQYFLMVPDCWSELGSQQSIQPEEG